MAEKFNPKKLIGLAPMAGPGDSGFRRICRECGADYTVTEMISAKAICYGNDKTMLLARHKQDEKPILIQLFGREKEAIAYATALISEQFQPVGIDLNMGCPAPKIFNNGDGSALLKDPKLAARLVSAAVGATSLPVSVKMRIGIDSIDPDIVEFARAIQDAGASFITVHGRTREQFYSGNAEYSAIRRIKEALSIPIIANGDVTDGITADKILKETGADGIMLARGALGRPYVFEEIKQWIAEGKTDKMTAEQHFSYCMKQLDYTIEDKGEEKGCIEFRKHLLWYLKGFHGCSEFKVKAGHILSRNDCEHLISEVLAQIKNHF